MQKLYNINQNTYVAFLHRAKDKYQALVSAQELPRIAEISKILKNLKILIHSLCLDLLNNPVISLEVLNVGPIRSVKYFIYWLIEAYLVVYSARVGRAQRAP